MSRLGGWGCARHRCVARKTPATTRKRDAGRERDRAPVSAPLIRGSGSERDEGGYGGRRLPRRDAVATLADGGAADADAGGGAAADSRMSRTPTTGAMNR